MTRAKTKPTRKRATKAKTIEELQAAVIECTEAKYKADLEAVMATETERLSGVAYSSAADESNDADMALVAAVRAMATVPNGYAPAAHEGWSIEPLRSCVKEQPIKRLALRAELDEMRAAVHAKIIRRYGADRQHWLDGEATRAAIEKASAARQALEQAQSEYLVAARANPAIPQSFTRSPFTYQHRHEEER